jgi:hypothetical protein
MEEPLVAQWFISIQSAAAEFDVPSRDREVSRVCDVPGSTPGLIKPKGGFQYLLFFFFFF